MLDQSPLNAKTKYDNHYNPDLLFPILRSINRTKIGIAEAQPFSGVDIWNHYEFSFLNKKGKPIVGILILVFPCTSPNIIESKSQKLYFNSFNNSKFDESDVVTTIARDLSQACGATVEVTFKTLAEFENEKIHARFMGENLDDQDITCDQYTLQSNFLRTAEQNIVEEVLCSDLLKSNCLVTNQPDWCSVQIKYKGPKIDREGLLQYIVSFRDENEFHENCIERIFIDLMTLCAPETLSVYGRSTRRGGLDINSFRTTQKNNSVPESNQRLCRQ